MHLIRKIEKFLNETDMPCTKFGRLSVRDPRLVGDLRNGRQPGKKMTQNVEAFMAQWLEQHKNGGI